MYYAVIIDTLLIISYHVYEHNNLACICNTLVLREKSRLYMSVLVRSMDNAVRYMHALFS